MTTAAVPFAALRAKVADLQRIEQAATAGEWKTKVESDEWVLRGNGTWGATAASDDDAALIVVARNLLPGMLDAITETLALYERPYVVAASSNYEQAGLFAALNVFAAALGVSADA